MLAHAFLVVTTAAQRRADTTGTTLIALTVNEFRRLFDALRLRPLHAVADILHGRHGAENTRQSPAPATTENTINTDDRDLRL
jgi:hypothetical protein